MGARFPPRIFSRPSEKRAVGTTDVYGWIDRLLSSNELCYSYTSLYANMPNLLRSGVLGGSGGTMKNFSTQPRRKWLISFDSRPFLPSDLCARVPDTYFDCLIETFRAEGHLTHFRVGFMKIIHNTFLLRLEANILLTSFNIGMKSAKISVPKKKNLVWRSISRLKHTRD